MACCLCCRCRSKVQIKKPAQRELIEKQAFQLFAARGFKRTRMAQIAAAAGMTVANIYVYFPSKAHLLYAIYRPMLMEQLEALAAAVRTLQGSEARVRRIFAGLWVDVPAEHNNFANNLMQALAEADPEEGKADAEFLTACETFVTNLLRESLPAERRHLVEDNRIAHLIWMAFDGFVINRRLGDVRNSTGIADLVADLLLTGAALPARRIKAVRA